MGTTNLPGRRRGEAPATSRKRSQAMNGMRYRGPRGLWHFATATAVLLLAALAGGATAQGTWTGGGKPAMLPSVAPAGTGLPTGGDGVIQAGCASCSAGLLGSPGPDLDMGGCGGCGGCGGACNGRRQCDCCCDGENCLARLFCGFYQCVCCP